MKRIKALWMVLLLVLNLMMCACQPAPGGRVAGPGKDLAVETAVDKPDVRILKLMSGMSLRQKVLQLFIVTPQQRSASAAENRSVGGLIFFADDLQNREQTITMIDAYQAESAIGLLISVDEEGGAVSRLGKNGAMGVPHLPAMGSLNSVQEAYQVGAVLAEELKKLGFNLNFAPVADVDSNPDNPVIGDRAFSSDAEIAAERVAACVEGFVNGGILCTLKHFPGHGDTDADSHLGLAVSTKTLEELRQCEWLPFQSGIAAGAQLVMVGHIALPNVTGDHAPASLSYSVSTELLREELDFQGVIITDSLSMGAITREYTAEEAAVRAIQAGADILLMPEDLDAAVEGVLDAVTSGTLSQARIDVSVYRILSLKLNQGILN